MSGYDEVLHIWDIKQYLAIIQNKGAEQMSFFPVLDRNLLPSNM